MFFVELIVANFSSVKMCAIFLTVVSKESNLSMIDGAFSLSKLDAEDEEAFEIVLLLAFLRFITNVSPFRTFALFELDGKDVDDEEESTEERKSVLSYSLAKSASSSALITV